MKCSTCKWWNKTEPGHTYADCRRQPPQFNFNVNVKRSRYGDNQDEITVSRFPNAQWPNTNENDWCGEYAPSDAEARRIYKENLRGDF